MSALTLTRSRRKSSRGVTASAVLALALSAATGAFAQTNAPPANTQVVAPKQVRFWTVIGSESRVSAPLSGRCPGPRAAVPHCNSFLLASKPAIAWRSAPRNGS